MSQLPTDHPWLYNKFVQEGCHSVSRSSRIWSGLSTDLTIEQTMMRAIKGRSGLTHVNCLMLFRLTSLFWCVSLWKKECITVRSSIAQITNPSNVMFIFCRILHLNVFFLFLSYFTDIKQLGVNCLM